MDLERLDRVLVRSAVVTLLFGLAAAFLGLEYALGLVFSGWWSTINIWVWKVLLEMLLHDRPKWQIFMWANIKLPLLYGSGALIIYYAPLSKGALLVGFHVPFVLILLEAIYLSLYPLPGSGPEGHHKNAG